MISKNNKLKKIFAGLLTLLVTSCGNNINYVTQPLNFLSSINPINNNYIQTNDNFNNQFQNYKTIKFSENQIIVKYKNSKFGIAALNDKYEYKPVGVKVVDSFEYQDAPTQLHLLPEKMKMQQALEYYQRNPQVEFAVPNATMSVSMSPGSQTDFNDPNDPNFAEQWYLPKVNAPQAWQFTNGGSPEVIVAVLDTGVDYNHPDLKGKIILGPDYIDKDNDPKDEHGHGTHVTGIICAGINNSEGIVGVAPNVKVMAIRILDKNGNGSLYNIAKAMAYAANNKVRVINLSLGSPPGGIILKTIAYFVGNYVERKGALLIAAAGNEGGKVGFPAASSKFMAVGAINERNVLASFSNRGKEISVVAPGTNILSTFPTYHVTANDSGLPMNYASLNGTSMATPIVSAQAALIFSRFPYSKPSEVRKLIENNTLDLGEPNKDALYGNGLINISKSLGIN